MLTRSAEPLSRWTTLRLGGAATRFFEVASRRELYDAAARADADGEPLLVLGGGSNLVVGDAGFSGTVVRVGSSGTQVVAEDDASVTVRVEAGEDWDRLVARAVREGWAGLEALSGIPGTVGAAPLQNVGAYGQEVAQTVTQVHVYDRSGGTERRLSAADCGFGYRTSLLKRSAGRFVVGGVTFRLRREGLGSAVTYAELAGRLGVAVGERAPVADVRRAVLELRRGKAMVLDDGDPDTVSAGSFFLNPIVSPSRLPAGAPSYPQGDGRVKTSAAWLIERAGFAKGYRRGRVALSSRHVLALTNRGGGSTAELLALAAEVRDGVERRFGIRLEPEPTLVNCSL